MSRTITYYYQIHHHDVFGDGSNQSSTAEILENSDVRKIAKNVARLALIEHHGEIAREMRGLRDHFEERVGCAIATAEEAMQRSDKLRDYVDSFAVNAAKSLKAAIEDILPDTFAAAVVQLQERLATLERDNAALRKRIKCLESRI